MSSSNEKKICDGVMGISILIAIIGSILIMVYYSQCKKYQDAKCTVSTSGSVVTCSVNAKKASGHLYGAGIVMIGLAILMNIGCFLKMAVMPRVNIKN
jgi:hypothetical protein